MSDDVFVKLIRLYNRRVSKRAPDPRPVVEQVAEARDAIARVKILYRQPTSSKLIRPSR